MSRLEDATKRLETAVRRLEAAIDAKGNSNGADPEALETLAQARADYAALKDVTDSVRGRLNGAIGKLQTLLDA